MASDRLYELLAQAKSRPSRAYRTLESALGAVNDIGSGYMKGQEIQEAMRQRELDRRTIGDVFPSNERLRPVSGIDLKTLEKLGGLKALADITETKELKEQSTMAVVSPALAKITGIAVGTKVPIDDVRTLLEQPKPPNPLDDELKRVRIEEIQRRQGSEKSLNTSYSLYKEAEKALEAALDKTTTGPIVGRLPAYTSAQQTADSAVASMAPVLKQLFRSAGEGIFSDKDQELLLRMVTDRTIRPEARKTVMKNVGRIVRAKLGKTNDDGGSGKTYQKTAKNAQGVRIGTNDNWKTFEPVQE